MPYRKYEKDLMKFSQYNEFSFSCPNYNYQFLKTCFEKI